ncbi:MAG: hypothetical protein ACTSU5_16640 [Promethearchaeota archaeon]
MAGVNSVEPAALPGEYRTFLEERRESINQRVNDARRRYRGSLDLDIVYGGFTRAFLNLFSANLRRKGEVPSDKFDEAFDVLLDLFLLAVSRKYYTGSPSAIKLPNMTPLFDEVFPRLLPLILEDPVRVPAIIFNASEHIPSKAGELFELLLNIEELLSSDNLKSLIGVIFWILGEPRCREESLHFIGTLDPTVASKIVSALFARGVAPGEVEQWVIFASRFPLADPCEWELGVGATDVPDASENPRSLFNSTMQFGAFSGFPGGSYPLPPRIAGVVDDEYLVLHAGGGSIHFTMVDGLGLWEYKVRIPRCESLIYVGPGTAYGIVNSRLHDLVKGKNVFLRASKQELSVFQDEEYLYVLLRGTKDKMEIRSFYKDWDRNTFYPPTKKLRAVSPKPVRTFPLSEPPVMAGPGLDGSVLIEIEERDPKRYILTSMHELGNGDRGVPSYSSEEPFVFTRVGDWWFTLSETGTLKQHTLDFSEELWALERPELRGATSLCGYRGGIFATTRYSFHVYGYHFDPRIPPGEKIGVRVL